MNKIISLIKVSLNHDMNLFKINTKKQSKVTKILLPVLLTGYLMLVAGTYSVQMIEILKPLHLEFIVLTLFTLTISILTLVEGIYKSSSLLFNCKDDNLLLSLPIKKSTILFIRILKFYLFELVYNTIFIIPSIGIYAYYVRPEWTFYLSSLIALLILPIIPVILSCIIGFIITHLASKFKKKNLLQTIFSMIFILLVFYITYNIEGLMNDFATKATTLNELITKLYYPVGTYISLVNKFELKTMIIYILSHILLLTITISILGKTYYKINSNNKRVITNKNNKEYKIKTNNKVVAFIKKELNRFFETPVFIVNSGFGLVLFLIAIIYISFKYESLMNNIALGIPGINIRRVKYYMPTIISGLICFTSFMTSITSSMISLEGKTFNILKSFPIESKKIVLYKVYSALVIMLPCILLGDLILFIRFKIDIINILLLLIISIIMPFLSELIGIIINLKYPKIDATNDTEVVKQSMSSMMSVFIGMIIIFLTIILALKLIDIGLTNRIILLIFNTIYGLITLGLWTYLTKTCDKSFNNIIT